MQYTNKPVVKAIPWSALPMNISYYNLYSLDLGKTKKRRRRRRTRRREKRLPTLVIPPAYTVHGKKKKSLVVNITQRSFIKVKFYSSLQQLKEKEITSNSFLNFIFKFQDTAMLSNFNSLNRELREK